MHIHAGIVHALITFAYVIIIGFFWRFYCYKNPDNSLAQGMAFCY